MKKILDGVVVLDLTRFFSGPQATLLLAGMGAEVIKIDDPKTGDPTAFAPPFDGPGGISFERKSDQDMGLAYLKRQRGKKSMTLDLKSARGRELFLQLAAKADVVVENFSPGVATRLAIDYTALCKVNPRIIYCAITGYGQDGPRANVAAHDLNYIAQAGLLALAAGSDGAPVPPPALIADIGGGTYPAVINILLALRSRDQSGQGCKLDIAMADNLFTFMYWAMGNGEVAGEWPTPGGDLVTGGSPRYNVYKTRDGKFVAAAPLEQKFWENFCALIELEPAARDDSRDAAKTRQAVAQRIAAKTADEWRAMFAGKDICCCIMASIEDARRDPHFVARGVFEARLAADGRQMTAMPVPVAPQFRAQPDSASYPALGEANSLLK